MLQPGLLLTVGLVLGAGLAAVESLAWGTGIVHGWIGALQVWYGLSPVPLWARADLHIHAVVAFAAALCLGCFMRLGAPRTTVVLPVVVVLAVAVGDELVQSGGPGRQFELQDLLGGAVGLAAAVPVLRWLRSAPLAQAAAARVRRPPRDRSPR